MSITKLPILLLLKAQLKCLPSLILFFTLDLYRVFVSSTGAWMGKLGPLNFAGAVLDVLVVVWW